MLSIKQLKPGWLGNSGSTGVLKKGYGLNFPAAAVKQPDQPPALALDNSSYLPSVDGFRAIAVLIVLIAHFGLGKYIPGGFGVMLFFFISGFLITRLLIAESEKKGSINLKNFYIRRLIRLYPPLLFMLLVFPSALALLGHKLVWQELAAVLLYFENYYLVYFPGAHALAGYFNIFWSLAVEEHFYLLYPVFFLVFYKRKNLILILALFIFAALAIRLYYVIQLESALLTGYDDPSYEPTYMLSHCRYDSILFGCMASLLIQKGNKVYRWLYNNKWVFSLAMGILLICLISRGDFFRNSFRYSLQGLALMFIVPPIVLSSGYIWFNQILSSKWLLQIGKMSYSLYVMHWVGIMLAGDLYPQTPMMYLDVLKPWPWYLVAMPVTVILTLFSYYAVEKNFIRLRAKFGSIIK